MATRGTPCGRGSGRVAGRRRRGEPSTPTTRWRGWPRHWADPRRTAGTVVPHSRAPAASAGARHERKWTVLDDLRSYLQMATGLTEATTSKAKDVVTSLLSQGMSLSAKAVPAPEMMGQVPGARRRPRHHQPQQPRDAGRDDPRRGRSGRRAAWASCARTSWPRCAATCSDSRSSCPTSRLTRPRPRPTPRRAQAAAPDLSPHRRTSRDRRGARGRRGRRAAGERREPPKKKKKKVIVDETGA